MYRLIKQEGRAKRGEFTTVHGVIQTPVFMNVNGSGDQGCRIHSRLRADRNPGGIIQHLPSACQTR